MTGNEITAIEKELWKKVFRLNFSIKQNIKKFSVLKEKCEREMYSPSNETINQIRLTQSSLNLLTQASLICEVKLVKLNPKFHLN